MPEPPPRDRPIPPPRNQADSAQKVHHLASKLSLLPPGQEPVKLSSPSSPEIISQKSSPSRENGSATQTVKPPPASRDQMDVCQPARSASDSQARQISRPAPPPRSTTFGGRSVQKSGSAEQLLASVVTKAGLGDGKSFTLPRESLENRRRKLTNTVSETE